MAIWERFRYDALCSLRAEVMVLLQPFHSAGFVLFIQQSFDYLYLRVERQIPPCLAEEVLVSYLGRDLVA